MDLHQILSDLSAERARVDQLIKAFEAIQTGATPPRSRRGRKSMDKQGRLEVSERMKRYWAQRRGGSQLSNGTQGMEGHRQSA